MILISVTKGDGKYIKYLGSMSDMFPTSPTVASSSIAITWYTIDIGVTNFQLLGLILRRLWLYLHNFYLSYNSPSQLVMV
jgi:hypothetical protein